MGSIKRLRISPAEVVALYLGGESAGMVSLRAKVPVSRITEILTNAGVRIRGKQEAVRLAQAQRKAKQAAA